MVSLAALWLPIVLSAIIVFIASSIIHMVLPYHKSEYHGLPDEERVLTTLRGLNLKPGRYVFPYCAQHKDMNTPAMVEKYKQGPVGMMSLMPNGPVVLPKFLAQWFGYCLVVGVFVAYLTGHTVAPGTDYLAVFRVAGTTAFLSYGLGHVSDAIWKGQTWSATIKEAFDGLVYGLLTAGTFGWLWPR